jgi:hypothetical protein
LKIRGYVFRVQFCSVNFSPSHCDLFSFGFLICGLTEFNFALVFSFIFSLIYLGCFRGFPSTPYSFKE